MLRIGWGGRFCSDRVKAWAFRSAEGERCSSAKEFQELQSGHLPSHFGDWWPQFWQAKTVLTFIMGGPSVAKRNYNLAGSGMSMKDKKFTECLQGAFSSVFSLRDFFFSSPLQSRQPIHRVR
jgi:hypothetical protein